MTALKATAIKNRILAGATHGDYTFALKNERDGDSDGASGFITNNVTGKVVFVTTDVGSYAANNLGTMMFRSAKHLKDYQGARNQWTNTENNEFVSEILAVLD